MFDTVIKVEFGGESITAEKNWIGSFIQYLDNEGFGQITDSQLLDYTQKIKKSIEYNLYKGLTYDGTPAEALSPVTIKKKKHHKIFFDTGELYRSLIIGKIPNGYEIFINESRSQIAYWLQFGTKYMPKRPFFGVIPERADSLLNQTILKIY